MNAMTNFLRLPPNMFAGGSQFKGWPGRCSSSSS